MFKYILLIQLFSMYMFGGENDFTMNNILGVKWKVTSEKGEKGGKKGELIFTMKKDTLYTTFKNKEDTKNKWIIHSTQMTYNSSSSNNNEIRFDKTESSGGSNEETNEENIYITTEDITFSKIDNNIFRLSVGYSRRPLKITENNRFNQSNTKTVSVLRKK
jgi:hypothetical protein